MRTLGLTWILICSCSALSHGASVSATYLFQNTLNASEGGVPALTTGNPLSGNAYITESVFGNDRTVYQLSGTPSQPSGLTFHNGGAIIPDQNYSVEMIFRFTSGAGTWRRILNVDGAENGIYISSSNYLRYYPTLTSSFPVTWDDSVYTHLVVATSADQTDLYINGSLSFSVGMGHAIASPDDVVRLFLDNTFEYAPANIALARFYSGTMNSEEVSAAYANPFTDSGVPEPISMTLAGAGLAAIMLRRFASRTAKVGTTCS